MSPILGGRLLILGARRVAQAELDAALGRAAPPAAPARPFALNASDPDVRPWAELVRDGTFSAASVAAVPTSFMVGPKWEAALRQSIAQHGATWLHQARATQGCERGAIYRVEGLG